MKRDRKIYPDLLLTFMKIGLFTFGGGYAMISMIEDSCVERKKWISTDDMMNVTVIAESTPGPIAINAATYIGYRQAGFAGAVCATLGMIIPSFAIIYLISGILGSFLEIKLIANAFRGIRIAVGLIILDAAVKLIKKMKKKAFPVTVMLCSFILMLMVNIFAWNISTVSIMLAAGCISLLSYIIMKAQKQKGGEK